MKITTIASLKEHMTVSKSIVNTNRAVKSSHPDPLGVNQSAALHYFDAKQFTL